MKKIMLLALITLMMVGCDLNPEGTTRINDVYYSITVDSCEYIICKGRLRGHKGNCKFCKERRKKELKELITMNNWIDFDMMISEIKYHRENAQKRISQFMENENPSEFDRYQYHEAVGEDSVLRCLQAWCNEFKFSLDEVKEFTKKKRNNNDPF